MDMSALIYSISARQARYDSDYTAEDGYIHCGKCGGARQQHITISGVEYKVPVMCSCEKSTMETENLRKASEEKKRITEARRLLCFGTNGRNAAMTFSVDKYPDSDYSEFCRRYVAESKYLSSGMLLYGDVGTGKTFYGCSMLNALVDLGIDCKFFNIGEVVQRLFSGRFDLGSLQEPEVLMLDDLGTTRETDYAAEQIYNIIDSRYRSGKTVIVTTNLTPSVIKNAVDMQHRRIYDRLMEMCLYRVHIPGKSQRGLINAENLPLHGV